MLSGTSYAAHQTLVPVEITPFVAIDGGNGNGLFVNVRETRYTAGLRYAVF